MQCMTLQTFREHSPRKAPSLKRNKKVASLLFYKMNGLE